MKMHNKTVHTPMYELIFNVIFVNTSFVDVVNILVLYFHFNFVTLIVVNS